MAISSTTRPGRAAIMITRCREKHRFVDRVGDEHHRQVLFLPETQQVAVEFVTRNFITSARRGSSISSSFGRVTRPRAMETRICMPPESSRGRTSANLPSPTSSRTSLTRVLPSARGTPARSSGSLTLCARCSTRHQGGFLEDERERMLGFLPAIAPPQHQLAVAGLHRAGDHLQQRTLPAAGRAEQGNKLP